MRRPQRQDRHDRRVRTPGRLHPRHQDHAGGAPRPRRRLAGHAGVGAGAGALRQPRGHHRAATRDGEQARPPLRRRAGPRRSRHRGEAHPQSARLHRRARHRPRPGGRRPRHAQARAQDRERRRQLRLPDRHPAGFPRRSARRLPLLRRPLPQGRIKRRLARLDAAAPQGRRPAPHQRAGRRHQLHQLGSRPAAACLRCRQAHRRHPRAPRQGG